MKFNQEIDDIYKGVEYFLNNLRKPNNKYSYLPALKGLTEEGKNLSLGFSCYALKINFMLGKVSKNSDEINNWANYLNSFQYQFNSVDCISEIIIGIESPLQMLLYECITLFVN